MSDGELLNHRFAVYGNHRAMQFYRWMDAQSESNRLMARRAWPKEIDLWQRALELRGRPFMPGCTTVNPHTGDSKDDQLRALAFEVRLGQAILSVQTSKVALDCCLDGAYSQSLALCRSLMEGWKRMAYVRRSWVDAFRWVPREWMPKKLLKQLGDGYYYRTPDRNEWAAVLPGELAEDHPDHIESLMVKKIREHIEDLNEHAHPSYLGYTQHLSGKRPISLLHPEHDAELELYVLHEGCVAETHLMLELMSLLPEEPEWRADIGRWQRDMARLFSKDHPIHADNEDRHR